ncbi:MAG: PfkB family carbohydrate kinase, partial [Pseudomonadota bacterium]
AQPDPATAIARQHASSLRPGDWLAVQGNLNQEATLAALQQAKRRRASTFFNSAPIQWDVRPLLPFVDLLVLNRPELAALADTDDPASGGERLLEAGVRQVVVTLGSDGAAIVDEVDVKHLAAKHVKTIDTAGAGDTFCGATIAGLAEGADLTLAATLGMRAAAITVTRPGTQPAFPTTAEAGLLKSRVLAGAPG